MSRARRLEPALEANLARLMVLVLEACGHCWSKRANESLFYLNVSRPRVRNGTVARFGPEVGLQGYPMLSLKDDV